MDRFEYRNFFSANIVPRQGTLLVSGDGKMDGDYCQNYTIKLSHAFWKDIQAYCTGPSMAMNFCYLLDTGINSLLKREKCLLVSAVNSVSVMKKEGDYIVDVRAKQNDRECAYKSLRIPCALLVRVKGLIIGRSVARGIEAIIQERMYELQQHEQTCFIRWQG